jgi:hypothetical protein
MFRLLCSSTCRDTIISHHQSVDAAFPLVKLVMPHLDET